MKVKTARGEYLIEAEAVAVPDLIKINVEGFEYDVLAGLEGLLRSARPLEVVFEHSSCRLAERCRPGDENVALLRGHGFTFYVQSGSAQLRPLRDEDLAIGVIDVIARRP